MLQKLRNWLSPEARARRQRQAERKGLLAELSGISTMRLYGYSREAEILKRLRVLNHIDGRLPEKLRAPSLALHMQRFGRITRAGAPSVDEYGRPPGRIVAGGVTIGPDGIDFGHGPNVLAGIDFDVEASESGRGLHIFRGLK